MKSFFLALVMTLTFWASHAHAQFMVSLDFEKKTYVAYEPIKAQISVTNQSGADVVLSGPNGGSWLSFDIIAPNGMTIIPPRGGPVAASRVIKSGVTLVQEVNLITFFPMSDVGGYTVIAQVYYPLTRQAYQSQRRRISIDDGRIVWQREVGVPKGEPDEGARRRYQALLYRNEDGEQLYVRVLDVNSGGVFNTYSLGTIVRFEDPQITVDGNNKMQALFQSGPRQFSYFVINPDGSVFRHRIYDTAGGNKPSLFMERNNRVTVNGGTEIDPNAPAQSSSPAPVQGNPGGGLRRTSDIPSF